MTKVLVLGIDGAPPQFVFGKWLDELPNLKKLVETGAYGRIKSTIPPTTCMAWTAIFSGKDASDFGIYRYNKRDGFSYSHKELINSHDVKTEMIWDLLTKEGKRSYVIGVPVTYPIRKPINGNMVTGFMTPEFNEQSVYPSEFKEEIKSLLGGDYMFDLNTGLASYKNMEKEELLKRTSEMTKQQFQVLKHLIKRNDWDFATLVLIGSDRLEHTMWAHFDETARGYEKDSPFKDALKEHFIQIDQELGEVLELIDEDTIVIVSSDHGMDKMNFRLNFNDWLIKEGYLVLKESLDKPVKFNPELVDWSKTKAYSTGFYQSMIHLNIKGREPEGIVEEENYNQIVTELKQKLLEIKGDQGQEMDNKVYLAREIFSGEYAKYAPDIIFYADNLKAGTSSEIGYGSLYAERTLVGKDHAGHASLGIFVISGAGIPRTGNLGTVSIYDVMPTMLSKLGVMLPEGLRGKEISF